MSSRKRNLGNLYDDEENGTEIPLNDDDGEWPDDDGEEDRDDGDDDGDDDYEDGGDDGDGDDDNVDVESSYSQIARKIDFEKEESTQKRQRTISTSNIAPMANDKNDLFARNMRHELDGKQDSWMIFDFKSFPNAFEQDVTELTGSRNSWNQKTVKYYSKYHGTKYWQGKSQSRARGLDPMLRLKIADLLIKEWAKEHSAHKIKSFVAAYDKTLSKKRHKSLKTLASLVKERDLTLLEKITEEKVVELAMRYLTQHMVVGFMEKAFPGYSDDILQRASIYKSVIQGEPLVRLDDEVDVMVDTAARVTWDNPNPKSELLSNLERWSLNKVKSGMVSQYNGKELMGVPMNVVLEYLNNESLVKILQQWVYLDKEKFLEFPVLFFTGGFHEGVPGSKPLSTSQVQQVIDIITRNPTVTLEAVVNEMRATAASTRRVPKEQLDLIYPSIEKSVKSLMGQLQRFLTRAGYRKGMAHGIDLSRTTNPRNVKDVRNFRTFFMDKHKFGPGEGHDDVLFFDETTIALSQKPGKVWMSRQPPVVDSSNADLRGMYNMFLAIGIVRGVPFTHSVVYKPVKTAGAKVPNRGSRLNVFPTNILDYMRQCMLCFSVLEQHISTQPRDVDVLQNINRTCQQAFLGMVDLFTNYPNAVSDMASAVDELTPVERANPQLVFRVITEIVEGAIKEAEMGPNTELKDKVKTWKKILDMAQIDTVFLKETNAEDPMSGRVEALPQTPVGGFATPAQPIRMSARISARVASAKRAKTPQSFGRATLKKGTAPSKRGAQSVRKFGSLSQRNWARDQIRGFIEDARNKMSERGNPSDIGTWLYPTKLKGSEVPMRCVIGLVGSVVTSTVALTGVPKKVFGTIGSTLDYFIGTFHKPILNRRDDRTNYHAWQTSYSLVSAISDKMYGPDTLKGDGGGEPPTRRKLFIVMDMAPSHMAQAMRISSKDPVLKRSPIFNILHAAFKERTNGLVDARVVFLPAKTSEFNPCERINRLLKQHLQSALKGYASMTGNQLEESIHNYFQEKLKGSTIIKLVRGSGYELEQDHEHLKNLREKMYLVPSNSYHGPEIRKRLTMMCNSHNPRMVPLAQSYHEKRHILCVNPETGQLVKYFSPVSLNVNNMYDKRPSWKHVSKHQALFATRLIPVWGSVLPLSREKGKPDSPGEEREVNVRFAGYKIEPESAYNTASRDKNLFFSVFLNEGKIELDFYEHGGGTVEELEGFFSRLEKTGSMQNVGFDKESRSFEMFWRTQPSIQWDVFAWLQNPNTEWVLVNLFHFRNPANKSTAVAQWYHISFKIFAFMVFSMKTETESTSSQSGFSLSSALLKDHIAFSKGENEMFMLGYFTPSDWGTYMAQVKIAMRLVQEHITNSTVSLIGHGYVLKLKS